MERWNADNIEDVIQQGGGRKPTVAPQLAAWRILYDAHLGRTGPAITACRWCELPMVADEPGPPAAPFWEIEVGQQTVRIDTEVHTADGPLDWDEADKWFTERFPAPKLELRPAGWALEAAFMGASSLPILVWFFALSVVGFFFWGMADGWIDIPQR